MSFWTLAQIVAASIAGWEFAGWFIDRVRTPYRWKCQRTGCWFKVTTNDRAGLARIRDNHLVVDHPLGVKKETNGQRNDQSGKRYRP